MLIVTLTDRGRYINALRQIRTEGTDEHLTAFFFSVAIERMKAEIAQKRQGSRTVFSFL